MRFTVTLSAVIAAATLPLIAAEQTPAELWSSLQAKRDALPRLHQEFDVTQTFKTATKTQSSKRQITLDMAQGKWREKSTSGSGNHVRIFDGADLVSTVEGDDEYVRVKHRNKNDDLIPSPYRLTDPDWNSAKEVERRPCNIPGTDHQCVLIEFKLKAALLSTGSSPSKRLEGIAQMNLDTETGALLSSRTMQLIETSRGGHQSDSILTVKRMTFAGESDPNLFKLPEGVREVKQLSHWDAPKIKKQLGGKTAPELSLTDLKGQHVSLADLKGKTVLLDFWTTWCPPCRADAPAIDKLYQQYGDKNLAIIGISVSEERELVEKFLKQHPHSFPIALTTENEMPRTYQIGVFPTYIVIDPDGSGRSAVQGDQGFAELRKMLKKAGLELE